MAIKKKKKTESIRPGMFDAFEPPVEEKALLSHIERLGKLASALHTEESARNAVKEKKRAAARKEAAKKRAEIRKNDAQGRARPRANRVPEPSPWENNAALAYVVELTDGDRTGRLPAILVMQDFHALHPSPQSELRLGYGKLKPRHKSSTDGESEAVEEVATERVVLPDVKAEDAEESGHAKRGKYLKVEWGRRFAWSVALSIDAIWRATEKNVALPSAEDWATIHEALMLGAALRAGHRDIEAWDTALKVAKLQREEAPRKGGRTSWKNYPLHEKERELALAYLRGHPEATEKEIAEAIIGRLGDWLEEVSASIVPESPSDQVVPCGRELRDRLTKGALVRRIRTQLPIWREELGLQVDPNSRPTGHRKSERSAQEPKR